MNDTLIPDMKLEAFRLMEAAKTPNGKLGTSTQAITFASTSYKIQGWIKELEKESK